MTLQREKYRVRRPDRDRRREAIFSHWLTNRLYKNRGLTLGAFQDLCDAGEVAGLGPEEFYDGVSDGQR